MKNNYEVFLNEKKEEIKNNKSVFMKLGLNEEFLFYLYEYINVKENVFDFNCFTDKSPFNKKEDEVYNIDIYLKIEEGKENKENKFSFILQIDKSKKIIKFKKIYPIIKLNDEIKKEYHKEIYDGYYFDIYYFESVYNLIFDLFNEILDYFFIKSEKSRLEFLLNDYSINFFQFEIDKVLESKLKEKWIKKTLFV